MSDLISKEALTNEIVNKKANSDGYNSAYQTYTTAYHSGSATRQFEILDIIKKMPTVSEQEIRAKAIDCVVNKALEQLTALEIEDSYATVTECKMILREIAEKMKEVDNG